jgi:hypothetical protein
MVPAQNIKGPETVLDPLNGTSDNFIHPPPPPPARSQILLIPSWKHPLPSYHVQLSDSMSAIPFKHKVHIYSIQSTMHSVFPLVGIGTLPTPLSPASVPLPPEPEGGHTRLRVRGWGSPNSDDCRKSLALNLLCAFKSLNLYINLISSYLYLYEKLLVFYPRFCLFLPPAQSCVFVYKFPSPFLL